MKPKHLFPAGLLCLVFLIIYQNYQPGTWLTGWDNLHPELNLPLHMFRSVWAVWQEYQGVGLLGGMGHASDLVRQILLFLTSFIVPASMLRYLWVFAMLASGTMGMYALLLRLSNRVGAFAGALFYVTNLGTVQMFSVPFEAFVTHFGFLPWLFLAAIHGNFFWFAVVSLLSLTQGYVPTIFIVYCIALAIWTITTAFLHRSKKMLKTLLTLWAITICVNAFWLLPFLYFSATKTAVTIQAKINQIATDEVYLRNRAYGSILDTVQLKGFWLNTFDFDPQESLQTPVLSLWRTHADSPGVIVASIILFFFTIIGAILIIREKKHRNLWVVGIWIFSILMLTTDTPPFSWIQDLLRSSVPLFHQVFRFPFTKFSLLAGFSYSLLIGIALGELCVLWREKHVRAALIFGLTTCMSLQSYPILTGHLFYPPVQVSIPKEYQDLFSYLKAQPSGRIANLPQSSYWGWTYEHWGYTGSGFLWYGVKQPILDRAFDVWSAQNENYYWELSAALYAKDAERLESVFRKYDVKYILMDENVVSASNNRALFIDETKYVLEFIPTIKKEAVFGKLTLYTRTDDTSQDFVTVTSALPSVNSYSWTDNDIAYRELGNYVEGNEINYPYRSLFTKRAIDERDFDAASLVAEEALVYDSDTTTDLNAQAVKECGLLKNGKATAVYDQFLRFDSLNQRGCLSFSIPDLPHREGYLVAVESRHIEGRPLLFSLINETAKHVESESYLPTSNDWQTTYFILPPLASDGLGYNPYISNDSIGRHETVNDIRSIRIYQIPYNDLVYMRSGEIASSSATGVGTPRNDIQVNHPNPAYYKVILDGSRVEPGMTKTLILSQSYDHGWIAYDATNKKFLDHVLVNNWENGWKLETSGTIYIFFWPQLLEFIGFLLLPIPFITIFFPARNA